MMETIQKCNILLVDDRPENLVALESVLSNLDQNLVKAGSGREALKRLLEREFAVILLDVQMPEMDGFETATLIRAREKTRRTPIIFLTAINKSEIHVARGYAVGAVDYVFKPFDPEVLKAKVAAFVELFRKTRELETEIASRKRTEEKLDLSNSILATISRALVGFIDHSDPALTFDYLLGSILSFTKSDYGFIGEIRYAANGDSYLRVFAISGPAEQRAMRESKKKGPSAGVDLYNLRGLCEILKVIRRPILANDPSRVPSRRGLPAGHPRLRSFLGVPFYKGVSLVGMLGIANRPGGYDDALIASLDPFVNTCASIIDAQRNAERREQAEERVRQLNEELERRVAERTAELAAANWELEIEILERKRSGDERIRLLRLEQTARAQAEAAQRRLKFLGQASAVLSGSLDYQTTLERVAGLAIPYLADFCVVDLVEEEGIISRVATAHADPAKQELMRELQSRLPPSGDSSLPVSRVLRTGTAEIISETDPSWLGTPPGDPGDVDSLHLSRELAPTSCMVVPLVARGHPIGAISFGASATSESGGSGRRYSSEDLVLAQDLARRAAAAIDNARLFREIQKAAERKDEFLAMLAHELRNPLAAISYADHALDQMGPQDERMARLRGIISRQTTHLTSLVDDLLDTARITRGKIELQKQPVELAVIVRRAVESIGPLVEARGHELSVSLPPGAVWLEADAIRLEQVISNLLNNAAKYTEPGGQIWLTAEVGRGEERTVEIRVRDTGKGIPPEMLPSVFELFTQVDRSLDRSQGGLGIGLALVRGLVQMHGGTVAAYSDGPGTGSEFVIRLPLLKDKGGRMEDESGRMKAEEEEIHPSSFRPQPSQRRVLIVEDNPDAAETLAEILQLWGYDVRIAHSGPQALQEAEAYQPEVVLLDIGLPGIDGYEVARRLRKAELREEGGKIHPSSFLPQPSDLPQPAELLLVALTGYGQPEDRRRAREAGFDLHLTKPVDPQELRRVLAALPGPNGSTQDSGSP